MPPRVTVERVTKVFRLSRRGPERLALSGISLGAESGEVLALVGPNGAGKTTLLNVIAGFTRPTSGTVRLMGLDPFRNRTQLVRHLGVVLDSARLLLMPLTVEQNLTYLAYLRGLPRGRVAQRVRSVLEAAHAEGLAKELAFRLSRGQRQRVLLAAALLTDPEILLLDEPTAGLDPDVAEAFGTFLAREAHKGRTVVVASHDLAWLEQVASRVVILSQGRVIASGSLRELIARQHARFTWWLREQPSREAQAALQELGVLVHDPNPPEGEERNRYPRFAIDFVTDDVARVQAIFDALHRFGCQVVDFRQAGGDLRQMYRDLIRAEQEELLGRLSKQEGKDR